MANGCHAINRRDYHPDPSRGCLLGRTLGVLIVNLLVAWPMPLEPAHSGT